MSTKLHTSANIAVLASIVLALASASGTEAQPSVVQLPQAVTEIAPELVTPAPAVSEAPAPADVPAISAPESARPATLAALVAAQPVPSDLPRELNCLAGAIYFEAKSESLSGQLAVGRVIVARSKSGRFPNSYCGVVFQPSQFSFVRGGGMPGIPRSSQQWRRAVAIAQIAHAGSWRSPVEGALYFHAAYVNPAWRLARVGRVENHVFYR
jgi:N-acetylmuramoyl-L-alanine amidase